MEFPFVLHWLAGVYGVSLHEQKTSNAIGCGAARSINTKRVTA